MGISGEEFLRKDGAIELFCELGVHGSSYSELDEKLDISHTTLTTRIEQARELGLLDKRLAREDEDSDAIYYPTDSGARFMIQIRQMDVLEAYKSQKQAREEFEKRSDDVRTWMLENAIDLGGDRRDLIKRLENYHTVGAGSEEDI